MISGDRMGRLFDVLPPGPVVIIGSDIPDIEPADIADAFKALGGNDAVLGPAPDGGYWLIGRKRTPRIPKPFAKVRWSSCHALQDTLANLQGLRVALLRELNDIDTAQEYGAWRAPGTRLGCDSPSRASITNPVSGDTAPSRRSSKVCCMSPRP